MKSSNDKKIKDTGQQSPVGKWAWVILTVVILLAAVIRMRLAPIPFERDEGEYAYAGQIILQGIPPYEKVYNMKMPGIYAAYALLLAIFGQTHTGIHIGLIFINIATIVLVFILAKKLFDPLVGLFAGSAFALLSAGKNIQGFTANAEHFVILPALAAIVILLKTVNSRKYLPVFASGLLLGLAFMMKQHGAAFIIFAALYLFASEVQLRPFNWRPFIAKVVLFPTGVFLPFGLTCLILWKLGVFERFWFWTFDYAKHYVSLVPLQYAILNFKREFPPILSSSICLWALAVIGFFCLFRVNRFREKSLFVIVFLIFSFLSVCPGFYFRPHYFILFLPAVSLLIGVGAVFVWETFTCHKSSLSAKVMPLILTSAIFFFTLYQQWDYFFTSAPMDIARNFYGGNPFPESLEIARFIKQNSQKDDTVAIIGSEPQICFYSKRLSATSYVYVYPLMEPHPYAVKMQEEMIGEIESASPRFLIFVNVYTSWLTTPSSDRKIFNWFNRYSSFYHIVGIVDIISSTQTVYRWGTETADYSPRSRSWLIILQRNRESDVNTVLPANGETTGVAK